MPNRILRDWTDSDRFDGISPEAERLFVRLLMKADDYGRFHAEARRVRSACFPLLTDLRPTDIDGWLRELAERRLILRYRADDRDVLAINRFRQRLKQSVAKFPAPSGKPPDWLPDFPEVPGSSRNFPSETETETETDKHPPAPAGGGDSPDPPKKKRECAKLPDLPEALSVGEFPAWWEKWLVHRKQKRAPLTPLAADQQLATCAEWGAARAIAAIRHSIGSGYQGLFEPNGRNAQTPKPGPRQVFQDC